MFMVNMIGNTAVGLVDTTVQRDVHRSRHRSVFNQQVRALEKSLVDRSNEFTHATSIIDDVQQTKDTTVMMLFEQ
jgi:hypothetical protein